MHDDIVIIRPASNGFIVEVSPDGDEDDEPDRNVFESLDAMLSFVREQYEPRKPEGTGP